MNEGAILRMQRIFREDGKAVIVAADHGAIAGPLKGIESPRELVRICAEGSADAILAHRGFVRAGFEAWKRQLGLVLRASGGFTTLGGRFEEELIASAEDALRWAADAVAITVKFGHAREGEFIRNAARLISACEPFGMPVMIEAMAFEKGEFSTRADALAIAVRAAEEIGAAFVKAAMPQSIDDFVQIAHGTHVPIVLLGGERTDSLAALFESIARAMDLGASGVAMGRNIWGQDNPREILEAVVGLVHGGWDIQKVMAHCHHTH